MGIRTWIQAPTLRRQRGATCLTNKTVHGNRARRRLRTQAFHVTLTVQDYSTAVVLSPPLVSLLNHSMLVVRYAYREEQMPARHQASRRELSYRHDGSGAVDTDTSILIDSYSLFSGTLCCSYSVSHSTAAQLGRRDMRVQSHASWTDRLPV